MDLGKQLCLSGRKSKLNSRSNSAVTTYVFWKRCKFKPRVLNVKKTRCDSAPGMRSEALGDQITSGDVSGCIAFWFVKSLLSLWTLFCLRSNEHGPPTINVNEQQTSMLTVLFTVPYCFSGVIIIQFIHTPKKAMRTFKNLIS